MVDLVDRAILETNGFTDSALEKYKLERKKSGYISGHICQHCGAVIPLARRKAIPGVRLCVDCQEDLERVRY